MAERFIATPEGAMMVPGMQVRRALVAAAALLLLLLTHWQISEELVSVWMRSVTFNHCPLVPLISVWLAWEKRQDLVGVPSGTSLVGLGLFVGLQVMLVLGSVLDLQVVEHAALVLSVPALVVTFWGLHVARVLAFPLGFLVFAIPFGNELVPVLMQVTADFTVGALQVIGIPVFREGMYFELPSGLFEVAEACSGIRYLLASLTVGTLYAYVILRDWRFRVGFVLLAAVVPVIANGLRALGIVLIAHHSNMELATGVDHLIYGWLFFGLVMLLLVLLAQWLRRFEPEAKARPRPIPVPGSFSGTATALVAGAVGVLVSTAVAGTVVGGLANMQPGVAAGMVPIGDTNWTRIDRLRAAKDLPGYAGYDQLLQAHYRNNTSGRSVDVAVLLYLSQDQGRELFNLENTLVPVSRGRVTGFEAVGLSPVSAATANWQQYRTDYGRTRSVAYWYLVNGQPYQQVLVAKARETALRLMGKPYASALVEITGDGADSSLLADFVASQGALLNRCIAVGGASCDAGVR